MNLLKYYLYLTLAMILAGSSVVTGKILIENVPIFLSQTLSTGIAFLFLVPIAWFFEGNPFKFRPTKLDALYLFFQAFTGMFLFRIFLLEGLKHTSALESGIITSASPAILVLLSYIILKEVIHRNVKLGVLLCVIGLILITLKQGVTSPTSSMELWGNFLVLMAVFCEALFSVLRKKQSSTSLPMTSTALIVLITMLLFLPLGLRDLDQFPLTSITRKSLLAIFYYGAFCTAIAYVCWFRGIATIKASTAAGFTALMPITSILMSVVFLGEQLQGRHLLGTAIILGGIYLITRPQAESLVVVINEE